MTGNAVAAAAAGKGYEQVTEIAKRERGIHLYVSNENDVKKNVIFVFRAFVWYVQREQAKYF